ncbi:autotransporter domain-containing protein [Candidatus Thioglobus sp.]|nr:autotransporter domain-containing protein [Candidatus Thioglobus sp.]
MDGLTLTDLTGDAYNISGNQTGKLIFTFSNHNFYLTDFNELGPISSSRNIFGVPSTPSSGYDATINLIPGYAYLTTFDIKEGSDDSTLVNNLRPESESTPTQPLVRIDYDSSNNKIKVSYDSDDAGGLDSFSINSSGEFSSPVTFTKSREYTLINSDTSAPTISSTTVASDNSTMAVTFSEAVFKATGGSGALEASDFTISISGGTKTLSSATPSSISISGNVYTLGLDLSGTANGSETITVVPSSSTAIYDGAGNAASTSQSNNTIALNSDALPSPLNKTDVTASVKAMSGISIDAVQMNFTAVDNRIAWLNSNISRNSNNLSHQGIAFNFANPSIDKLMNTAYVEPGKLSPTNKLLELLRNNLADGTPDAMAMTADTKNQLNAAAFNEVAKLRQNTIDKVLHATGGSIMGDWNVWTEGRITVGKTYKTDTSSEQDSQTQNISLGFDRIIKDDNQSSESAGHIVGVVLGIGKSDADTTNNSTIDADSYSLSAYGVIRQNDKALVQAMMGYGHINVDKSRIDGSDTLTGTHNANQFFTSLMLKKETIGIGSFSLSPYGKIHASRTWYDGYSESGGATALTYGEQTIDSTVLSTGIDVDYMIPIHKGNIRPFAKFEYGADVSGSSTVNMHYNNETTNYQLQLDNKADSNWKFVIGTDMYTKDEWDSSISYERTEAVNAGYSNSLAVKVGLRF